MIANRLEKIRQYFSHVGFSGDELESVATAFELRFFPKGSLVVTEGRTSRHMGLVDAGLVSILRPERWTGDYALCECSRHLDGFRHEFRGRETRAGECPSSYRWFNLPDQSREVKAIGERHSQVQRLLHFTVGAIDQWHRREPSRHDRIVGRPALRQTAVAATAFVADDPVATFGFDVGHHTSPFEPHSRVYSLKSLLDICPVLPASTAAPLLRQNKNTRRYAKAHFPRFRGVFHHWRGRAKSFFLKRDRNQWISKSICRCRIPGASSIGSRRLLSDGV